MEDPLESFEAIILTRRIPEDYRTKMSLYSCWSGSLVVCRCVKKTSFYNTVLIVAASRMPQMQCY